MSRYDRSDVDPQDRYEDRPVDVADYPRDGQPWPKELGREPFPIDPAELATHRAIDAFDTLQVELAKVSDLERAWQLKRMVDGLWHQADRVNRATMDKIDVLIGVK